MGLGELGQAKTYLTISNGKITMRTKEGEQGAEMRKNKVGNEVWEKHFRNISGFITNVIEDNHPEYGRSFKVQIEDGEDIYQLQLQENSKYWNHFCQIFPNIELNNKIVISPYAFSTPTSGDKKIVGLNIYKNDQKIENYFIKKEFDTLTKKISKIEFLHDFPAPGKDLDPEDYKIYTLTVAKFLRVYFQNHIKPIFENKTVKQEDAPEEVVSDDLPF